MSANLKDQCCKMQILEINSVRGPGVKLRNANGFSVAECSCKSLAYFNTPKYPSPLSILWHSGINHRGVRYKASSRTSQKARCSVVYGPIGSYGSIWTQACKICSDSCNLAAVGGKKRETPRELGIHILNFWGYQGPVVLESAWPGMISGSCMFKKCIAWYDCRVLNSKKVCCLVFFRDPSSPESLRVPGPVSLL